MTPVRVRALLTIREAAELLGCSTQTIRRRIDDGQLRSVRLGITPQAPVRINPDDLAAWLDEPLPAGASDPSSRGARASTDNPDNEGED